MDPGSSSCLFPTSPPPYNSMTVSFDQLKEETDTHNNDGGVPLCRVCERGYDGSQHFGVEVCRACAAFFRRAIEGRKKFVCRKGGDSCQLNVSASIGKGEALILEQRIGLPANRSSSNQTSRFLSKARLITASTTILNKSERVKYPCLTSDLKEGSTESLEIMCTQPLEFTYKSSIN
ncbi:zinc finger, C4 type [Necator americanus]|uniref:Zinc finger, C4 type n=1 Tax=Necator americanus TaxID=51031 RepID=W2TI93_NECAM|nr:zinc finger, C4 type [Necator americanus]ETN81810.1 zinc finger, C4 type [Necator americanus]